MFIRRNQTTAVFSPDRVAYFETAGWRAYYERNWLRLLRLLVALCQEQFHIPFPRSLVAAYAVTRAAIAWVPVDHNIYRVIAYYEKFYRIAHRYSKLAFDPVRVATLETRYNDDHRRLVGQHDKSQLLETLVELHCALFGLTKEQARSSAELRLQAANTVDAITNRTSTDVNGDWIRIEQYLRQCYRDVEAKVARS